MSLQMPNSWYKNFAELIQSEREHFAFKRRVNTRWSRVAVIAPHGGGIEPGTTEIARAIAGWAFSFYSFEGIKNSGNDILHITSTLFDEPKCIALLQRSEFAAAIHGCEGWEAATFIGGLDEELGARLIDALNAAGFRASKADENYAGLQPNNICNRGRSGKGVQLELTSGLRRSMFKGLGRQERFETRPIFRKFALTVRKTLADYDRESRGR